MSHFLPSAIASAINAARETYLAGNTPNVSEASRPS